MARAGCWNHNVHYQPVILGAVPAGCGTALEVGCGDGLGLAANGSFGDYLAGARGVPVNLVYRALYREGSSGAPIKDPEMTWAEVRATARSLLPGVPTVATCCGVTRCSGASRAADRAGRP
jgi:hypothetical protein